MASALVQALELSSAGKAAVHFQDQEGSSVDGKASVCLRASAVCAAGTAAVCHRRLEMSAAARMALCLHALKATSTRC